MRLLAVCSPARRAEQRPPPAGRADASDRGVPSAGVGGFPDVMCARELRRTRCEPDPRRGINCRAALCAHALAHGRSRLAANACSARTRRHHAGMDAGRASEAAAAARAAVQQHARKRPLSEVRAAEASRAQLRAFAARLTCDSAAGGWQRRGARGARRGRRTYASEEEGTPAPAVCMRGVAHMCPY